MKSRIGRLACWLAPAVLAYGTAALAQDKPAGYPARPIRIIIGVAAGAGADMVARTTAQILTERWGQNVVVEPRPGGGGIVASEHAARAAPDGYTLYQSGFGILLQGATKRVPFDVLKTFEPVVRTTQQPYILLVHPSVPAKSFKDIVALSASKPLTYAGSSGPGSTVHIGMERLAVLSGMKAKHVAYKGSAPALLALMGGEINMAATSVMSATSAIRSGKVRGIASLGLKRASSLPELPTIGEQGFPGFSIANRYDVWAPAKTPRPVIEAINRVVSDGMHTPQVVQRLAADGSEPAERMNPAELRKAVVREYAELERTVKELGLQFVK
ncbi:MAG TPA: tripartite tricarboxylate transporter substrate binding protein [Burkholderiales bacterium]|nr:tripartite tricarboxylate transporter substrate binding protein [Burkholderiales bacterium]